MITKIQAALASALLIATGGLGAAALSAHAQSADTQTGAQAATTTVAHAIVWPDGSTGAIKDDDQNENEGGATVSASVKSEGRGDVETNDDEGSGSQAGIGANLDASGEVDD